jgi:hypothetical protein
MIKDSWITFKCWISNKFYVKTIELNPKGKSFILNLSKNECEKLKTGSCNVSKVVGSIDSFVDSFDNSEQFICMDECLKHSYSILKNGYI